MQILAKLVALIGLVGALAVSPMSAAETHLGPYLFEQLRKPEYKATFNALFKNQPNIEPWVKRYLSERDGVDAPMEMRMVAGGNYEFYNVCQPHNCMGNGIFVLFTPGGAHAWVLFTKDDGTRRFFGSPGPEMQAALIAFTKPQ